MNGLAYAIHDQFRQKLSHAGCRFWKVAGRIRFGHAGSHLSTIEAHKNHVSQQSGGHGADFTPIHGTLQGDGQRFERALSLSCKKFAWVGVITQTDPMSFSEQGQEQL
jgi:hypothetical protein